MAKAVGEHLPLALQDVSSVFADTSSGMIADGLAGGSVMMALPLKGLLGRLGKKLPDEDGAQLPRLGRELAGAAKLAGVKGIFHADELPAYGITSDEVGAVRSELGLGEDDGFVLCCALIGRPLWRLKPCSTVPVWPGTGFPKRCETWWSRKVLQKTGPQHPCVPCRGALECTLKRMYLLRG